MIKILSAVLFASLVTAPLAFMKAAQADSGVIRSDAGTKPGIEFKLVGDAGVPGQPPAVDPKVRSERRGQLLLFVSVLRDSIADQVKKPVQVRSVYFADQNTPTKDAAIVVFVVDGKEVANFFFHNNGSWSVFPADFSATDQDP